MNNSCKKNMRYFPIFLHLGRYLALLIMVVVGSGVRGQITEGFESGLPTSYNSSPIDVTLNSGTWQVTDVIAGTTGVQSGTKSAQIKSATSAQIITPTLTGGVGTISFWVTSSTASGAYQVNLSTDNGSNWSAATGSPFTIGTTKTQRTITVNDASVNKIQIYRTGATIYIDDFSTTTATAIVAPTTQASVISFTSVGQTGMTINWTNGNGAKRVVKMNTSNSFTSPTDGTDPTANTAYSGSGEQVIYNSSSNSVSVTGLNASTTYHFSIYEYNGSSTTTKYNTTTATGNPNSQATATPPPALSVNSLTVFGNICTNTTVGPNSFTIMGSNLTSENITIGALTGFTFSTTSGGTYTNTLSLAQGGGAYSQEIYVKFTPTAVQSYNGDIAIGGGGATAVNRSVTGSGVNTLPTITTGAATSVTTSGATVPGTISATGCTAISAYGVEYSTTSGFANGTGTQVVVSNLSGSDFSVNLLSLASGTTYYYKTYATNGGGISYSSQSSFITLKLAPTTQASDITFSSIGSSVMTVNCTSGDGDGRIILINTSDSFTNPVNGTSQIGSAAYSGTGEQCVYSGASNSVDVTNLSQNTSYWFRVYEYNNSGINISYKIETAGNNPLSQTTIEGPCALETFTNIPTASSTSYQSRSWTGDDGATWTATDARTDQTITGKAITIRNGVLTSPSKTGGIGTLSFKTKFSYAESSGDLTIEVNGTTVGTVTYDEMNGSTPITKTISNINVAGNIVVTLTSSGSRFTIDDLEWTCLPSEPTIAISITSITRLDSKYSEPSNEQSFTVSGTNLTGNISIAAPANYEISTTSESGFGSSITLNQSSGALASTTIYVRLKAGLDFGNYNAENIILSSTDATSKTVICSGTVSIAAPIATTATSVASNSFTAHWNAVSGANGYRIDVYKKVSNIPTDLFISEYIEGGGNEKYIEIYNGTTDAVDLSNYKLQLFRNGSISPALDYTLSGTLAAGSTIVYKDDDSDLFKGTATSFTLLDHNGDDAMVLYKISPEGYVDIFGRIGEDPGSYWVADTIKTQVKTLVRKPTVRSGITTNPTSGFTSLGTEWNQFPMNTVSELGNHTCDYSGQTLFINNVDIGNVLEYNVTGIEEDATYYYIVRAYNAAGSVSANSNEIPHIYFWIGASTAWNAESNWEATLVPAIDAAIGIKSDASNHCVLDGEHSVSDIILNSSSKELTLKGNKLIVKGNILNATDAQIDASAALSTIEYAGLNPQTIDNNLYTSNQLQNLICNNSAGLIQNTDLTVSNAFTINSAKLYQISAAKALTVSNTVTNSAGAGGLIIKAGNNTTANASFIYPQGQTVQATIEFYSKAWWDKSEAAGNKYKWQFFGIPISAGTHLKASPTFDGAYVRKFNEAGVGAGINNSPVKRWLQLTNPSEMEPFAGYEIVQAEATTYSIQGTMVNSDFSSGSLSYTTNPIVETPGSHIFSNPYTAAIDISQFTFGSETEEAVYQFHTGSHNEWDLSKSVDGELVGQYRVSPKSTAGSGGIPLYISSMQGFLIKKLHNDATNLNNFTFSIPYSAVKAKNTTAMRSPEQEKSYTTIDVTGNRFADKVWIFIDPNCSRAYDNGWDGRKLLGSVLTPQLLVREGQNDLQISAVDDINNTVLDFQPGEDETYTLTFKHTNIVFPELYLLDTETYSVTDISASGSTYSFTATACTAPVERFKIVTSTSITTDQSAITKSDITIFTYNKSVVVNNKTNQEGILRIIDVSGKTLQLYQVNAETISTFKTNLVPGSYIAVFENAVKSLRKNLVLR